MRHLALFVLALATTLAVPVAMARGAVEQNIDDCITLSDSHTAARVGSTGMVVRDGDAHYQLDFGQSCAATTTSSRVTIATGKQTNVVCPSGSAVTARHHHCPIRKATVISADVYDRHARRR